MPDLPETKKVLAPNEHVGYTVGVQGAGQPRYGTAISATYFQGLRDAPGAALEQIELGHEMCRLRQYADAETCFRAAVELEPDWPMAHNNLGWALQAQGKNEEAVVSYKKALQLDPGLKLARANLAFLLANLYFFIGKLAEAGSMWRILANLYPQDHEIVDNLISVSLRIHDLSEAGYWAERYTALTRGSICHSFHPHADIPCPDVPIPAPKLTRGKLRHDLEQYLHLRDKGVLGQQFDDVISRYRLALDCLGRGDSSLQEDLLDAPEMRTTYGRVVHHYPAQKISKGAISPSTSVRGAEQAYLESKLGVVVIDDFLSPEALSELQRFCLESTIWHGNGYSYERLGAFFRDGFNCPLLLQIAEEIQSVFPSVIGKKHPLLQMWGYKYRHDQPAMHPHADFAAVNVNFWITPDEANLEGDSGGLVIYDVEAPIEWGFEAYNRQGDRISEYLKAVGAKSFEIPYRCNRAVIFNSDLFHATAPLAFRPGYTDKRVNITMLYGEREAVAKR